MTDVFDLDPRVVRGIFYRVLVGPGLEPPVPVHLLRGKTMIRPLTEKDFEAAAAIVNDGWRGTYAGYVSPALLDDKGCRERAARLERDFRSRRLEEYVWEEEGEVLALLSAGETADRDLPGAFELWRLYVAKKARGKGIGKRLLDFGERLAREKGRSQVVIWAFRRNTNALAFYQKHGYRPDKTMWLGEPYRAEGVRLVKDLEQAGRLAREQEK